MIAASHDAINMPAVLVANGLGTWLMCILLLEKRRRIHRARKEIRIFHTMCRMCLTLCLLETLGFHLDGKLFPGARAVCLVINSSLFMLNAIFAYLWLYYVGHKLYAHRPCLHYIHTWAPLPALLICVLSIGNLFVEIFFGITADNVYYRTPMAFLCYFVTYLYILSGAVLAMFFHRRVDRSRFFPVGTFILPIFVGSAIQYINYGLALIWPSVAVGLTALHISLQNEENILDNLTGTYNRNYLIHYWEYVAERVRHGLHLTGILLDVNDFKSINDTYGHSIGDTVLYNVSKILKHAVDGHGLVARYGGDEFVILLGDSTPELVQQVRAQILSGLDAYNISGHPPCHVSLSMGIAELENTSLNELFNRMDQKMYVEKSNFYCQQTNGQTPAVPQN